MLPWLITWFVELDGNNETESLEPLVKCFIYLPTRVTLLNGLISYDEATFALIVDTLLQAASTGSSQLNFHISESIYTLVQQFPKRALAVRFKLVQAQILPELALRLTISHIHDDVDFLNGEFTGLPSWILSQSSKVAPHIATMKNHLCDMAMKEVLSVKGVEDADQLKLEKLLRAIIGVLGLFGIKATEEQFRVCLQVIRKAQTARSIELSLCFVLICAEQVLRLPLRERNALMKYVCETEKTEVPALIAIAFASNQILQVETLVRQKLNMNLMIPKLGLFEMQKLFKTLETDIYAKFSAPQI
ncbi:hypothetical protein INT43_001894 [Umbelopsis isabellina]|uniref:Uncharacterized protein n=1 Tax=Mortierella isabellina TaxID=91625 RepID=A0A8H7UDK7_MORIS|nr:hypothetical protein INT43_001894 [Umbelopsis isabellina]